MPDPKEKLKQLHTNLIKDGYELPSLDIFEKDMSDASKLTKLRDNLIQDGYELPDLNTFQADMGLKKKNLVSVSAKGTPTPSLFSPSLEKALQSGGIVGESKIQSTLGETKPPKIDVNFAKDYNKKFEESTGYKELELGSELPQIKTQRESNKYLRNRRIEENEIKPFQASVVSGTLNPSKLEELYTKPYGKKIVTQELESQMPGSSSLLEQGDPEAIKTVSFSINTKNRPEAVRREGEYYQNLNNELNNAFTNLKARMSWKGSQFGGGGTAAVELPKTDAENPEQLTKLLEYIGGADYLEDAQGNRVDSNDLVKKINQKLFFLGSQKGIDKEVESLTPQISQAVTRVRSESEKGEKDYTPEFDEAATEQFKLGLSFLKDTKPAEYQNIVRGIEQRGEIADTDFEDLARLGQDFYNQKVFTGGATDPSLIGKETDIKYTSRQTRKAEYAKALSEEIADMGYSNRWKIPQEIIYKAAENLGLPNEDIVQDIAANEAAGGYGIVKGGAWRALARGIAMPIKGIQSSVNAVVDSPVDTYLNSKKFDYGDQLIANVKGQYGEELPSEQGNLWYDMVEGFGQFIPQVILAKGIGAGLEKTLLAGRGLTAAQKAATAAYPGTFISTFAQSYGDGYKDALQKTGSVSKARLMGTINGLSSAAFELFLPDVKIADYSRGLLKSAKDNLAKNIMRVVDEGGGKEAARSAIGQFAKDLVQVGIRTGSNVAKESAEEVGTNLTNWLTEAIFSPATIKDRDLANELLETAKATSISMVIPALLGGAGEFAQNKKITRQGLNYIAINSEEYKPVLDKQLADGILSQGDYNLAMSVINSHKQNIKEAPRADANGDLISGERQLEYAFQGTVANINEQKAEATNDPVQKKFYQDKAKRANEVKEKILYGEDVVEGMPKEDIAETIDVEEEAAPQVPTTEEKTYRVEYFDPETRKMTHQMFTTEAEGEAFKKTLTREQTSQGVRSYFEKAPAKGVGEVEVAPETSPKIPREISSLKDDESVVFTVKSLEEIPEEFKDRAIKKEGLKAEVRKKIFGFPIGPKTEVKFGEGYTYTLTGKEAKNYAAKQIEVSPTSSSVVAEEKVVTPTKEVKTEKVVQPVEEVEAAPQAPAEPIAEEELPFGETAPRETVETKEEKNLTKRALNLEVSTPRAEVLQYFISGGKISPEALIEFFGKERRMGMGKIRVEERRSRTSLTNKNAPSIEALAEKIAGTDRLDQVQEYREAIEEALLNHSGTKTMAEELVRDYDVEFAEMKRAAELEELGQEIEAEVQAFVSQIPPAQQEEIMKVLDKFRDNDGFIDWNQIDEEIKGGFEPVLLELSEPSQKIINDAVKQFEETGRVGRISTEVISEEKVQEIDKRAEARKSLKDAFDDLTNLGIIYDPRSQAEKQVKLTKAIINVIKQEAIGAIKDLKKYLKDNIGLDISDDDAKYLLIESKKPEYAIQEPTAGQVPVQPEAGVSKEVEKGVPPTKPPKAPKEGEAKGKKVVPPIPPTPPKTEEEGEYTPRGRDKALINKLYTATNIPEEARAGFEKEGLRYQTKSQKEAELVAKGVIDAIGIDEALRLAESFEFDGDVNSLIYAESLNRLAEMERKAKTPEEKQALAKKFAEVGIQYGIKSQYGGRFNAAINYFYQKSPLGIVLMEDAKRKEEFNNFSKGNEQSWKEAYEIIKTELDALKEEMQGKKAKAAFKTAEARAEAARKKREALKEKYKKGKGGGLTLTTGGLTKEGIEYVGELVVTYIQEGVANVEVIIQRVFFDLRDVIGKPLDEATAKEVEKEVRRTFKENKSKTLDRIRKRLNKLPKKKQDEVVRRSFNQIIELGGLDFDDFKNIIADVTGYGQLTDQEKARFEELVRKTNVVERMAEKARDERTEESIRNFRKSEMEAGKAARELNQLIWNKPDILKRLTSIMQLSTLGIPALINNPIYNIWNQATLRFPVGLINDLVDRGITLSAQATGTEYQREYNTLGTQMEFFRKLGFGAKESAEQLVTGLNRQDYIQKEVGGQQIQPLQAAKDWWASFTGKKKLTTAQQWDKAIQMTVGVPAEAIARTLNIGDKPQRFAAEGAQAAAFAKAFGLKGVDYKLFIEFPREEAYRNYKLQGLSDSEAAKKADYVRDVIVKEGERATFQQDNLLNTALSAVFNTVFGSGKETGLANLIKATTVSPYIKIPTNAFWSYYNLVNPEIALIQSFVHGGRAYNLNKKGEKEQAKLALRESRYWLAHSVTGMAMKAVIIALVKAGVYNPGPDDESKREREGKAFYEGQGTINVDKLNAILNGQDPTQVKDGLLIPNRWFGQWGTVGNTIAKKYEDMTPEQRKNEAEFYDFMLGSLPIEALQDIEQGVFANSSSLLTALGGGPGGFNRWGANVIGMFTNIVHPSILAQDSRARLETYTTQKADSFLKELENSMLTRSSFLRKLTGKYPPSRISIWGEPMPKQGGTIQKLFNITKANKDMFARPLYDDAKKYGDSNFFPPAVTSSLDGKQLTVDQTRALQEFVGQARKARISPYINDSAKIEGFNVKYSDLKDPEDKKKVLNYLYEVGRKDGLDKFYNVYKDLKPKEKSEDFLKELQFDLFKTLQKYK